VTWAEGAELHAELDRALRARGHAGVIRVVRRPSQYATSFALHELDVELADGTSLALMLKDLGRDAPGTSTRELKPPFLYDPLREIEVYTELLALADLGTATCYGAVPERGWLFLERVRGVELFQVGPRSTWEHVARRLAHMHARLAAIGPRSERLIRYDEQLLRLWPRRAAEFAGGEGRELLERIAARYDAVVELLLDLPASPIHGEFYASNVLVDDPHAPERVCPVDWEMAALGPPLIDLAALVSGRWSDADRSAIALAYRAALPADARPPQDDFERALRACRLHLALQWLGWSASWTPPPEHANDWFGEAVALSRALGI